MPEKQHNDADPTPDQFRPPEGIRSPSTKDITKAVRELNICLKSVYIYPTEHDQVKSNIERTWHTLNGIFDALPDLTLAIAGNRLMIGNEYLDPGNAICKEFALSLKTHDIASISFYRGIDRDELLRLFLLIKKKPEDITDQGSIKTVVDNENFLNVKIKAVDYSKLSITEEKEISRRTKDDGSGQQDDTWRDFVSHLVSETITDQDNGVSIDDLGDIKPSELARLLNEHRIDNQSAIQTYDKVVTRHFKQPQADFPVDPDDKSRQASYDLTSWNTLLEELNPDIKKQFLSVSFEHCEPERDAVRTEEFLSSMSGGLIIDMLKSANDSGKEISPSLVNLIRKLSAAQGEALQSLPEDIAASLKKSDEAIEFSEDRFKTLFNREKHGEYVVDEYDDVLKKLTDTPASDPSIAGTDFAVEDYLPTLSDRHLDTRIARILIGFMNGQIEKDEYSAYAEKLIGIGTDLLEAQDFSLLAVIFKTFTRHKKNKTDPDIRAIASDCVNTFREPAFTSQAVRAFFKDGKLADRDGFNLLIALGPRIVPDIVKHYAEQDGPEMPGLLSGIITHFRKEALAEAQKRLRDTRTLFVRNLIVLLRILDARETENGLKQLLDHDNTDIQLEALETLLQFESQWALPVLRKLVRASRADLSSRAIFLAGNYRVSDMAEDLASMLKRFILFKADIKKNEEIIAALGQIGSSHTIPVLEKLLSSTPILHSREIAKMKLLVYQSLAGYTYNDVKHLLEKGSKAKDDEIKNSCQKIINQKSSGT